MTTTVYDFEEGTEGGTLNAAGPIVAVSSTKPTYHAAAAFTSSAFGIVSTGSNWAEWNTPATDWSFSIYFRMTTNPGTGSERIITFRNAGANQGHIRFHSDGTIQISGVTNSLITPASTVLWATGDNFRLDGQVDTVGSDLVVTLRIFKGANISGTTPDETLLTHTITGATASSVRFGGIDAAAYTSHWDNLRLSDTLEWLGPYVPAVVPLDTPVVTVTDETPPSVAGGTDGSITVTWPAVSGTDHYEAGIASGHDVTSGFTMDDLTATSPHTYTGLPAGNYTVAIRAVPA